MDVITGLPFDSTTGTLTDAEKEEIFRDYLADLTDKEKAAAFVAISCVPSKEFLEQQIDATIGALSREDMENMMMEGFSGQVSISKDEIMEYLASMSDEELTTFFSQMKTEELLLAKSVTTVVLMVCSRQEVLQMRLTGWVFHLCDSKQVLP